MNMKNKTYSPYGTYSPKKIDAPKKAEKDSPRSSKIESKSDLRGGKK